MSTVFYDEKLSLLITMLRTAGLQEPESGAVCGRGGSSFRPARAHSAEGWVVASLNKFAGLTQINARVTCSLLA